MNNDVRLRTGRIAATLLAAAGLSLGLTSRALESDGTERARASFGQVLSFRDREVQMLDANGVARSADTSSSSAYAAEVMYQVSDAWRVNGDIIWDPDDSNSDAGSVFAHAVSALASLAPSPQESRCTCSSAGKPTSSLWRKTSMLFEVMCSFPESPSCSRRRPIGEMASASTLASRQCHLLGDGFNGL